jgi:hypothetical protein
MYHCAQSKERQNAPKKSQREGAKHRDKLPMDAFECHGWLHITIMDGENIALIKIPTPMTISHIGPSTFPQMSSSLSNKIRN